MNSNVFKKDWDSIPQNYRYFILTGALLLFLTWLKDNWGNWHYGIFWGPPIGYFTFYGSLLFIFLPIVIIISKQLIEFPIVKKKVTKKYPRKDIDKKYKLVDTADAPGKIFLIDTNAKRRYWIASGPTFLDLGFSWGDVHRITREEFDKYTEGPMILTSGSPGH